jgi:HEAT repeat protein
MTAFSPLTFDPDALDPEATVLLPRLSDADPVVRRIALLELADMEDENLLPPIVHALRHDDSADVRREAARVLAAWERAEVVDALCQTLLDLDEAVRLTAAQSLSELKEVASGHVLLEWVANPDPFVQAAILRALRELRLSDALNPALRALSHPLASVRLEAVGVAGWLKDERALAQLAQVAAGDADPDVRRAAVGSLGLGSEPAETIVDADGCVTRARERRLAGCCRIPSAICARRRRLRSASLATVVCCRRCKLPRGTLIRKYARRFASRCNRSKIFQHECT